MKNNTKIFVLLFSLIFSQTCLYPQDDAYHFRFDHWSTRAMRYAIIRHPQSYELMSDFPFSMGDAGRLSSFLSNTGTETMTRYYLKRLQKLASLNDKEPVFFLTWQNASEYSDHPEKKENLKFESDLIGYARLGRGLSAYFDFQMDTYGLYDSDYHGIYEWKDEMVGDMRAAYFKYSASRWSLLIGRDYIHWGPGTTGALLTSGHAPALDMIKFTADLGRFRFQGFNAVLGRGSEIEEHDKINRYFAGHRLSLRLKRAEFGIQETIMYGGPREIIQGSYLNPLIPYYFTDVMQIQKRDDNVSLALDAAFYWPDNFRFYSQYMVDEYYYEGEHYPKRTAFLVGFDWINAFGQDWLWLNCEYVRADRWTYNYNVQSWWNRLNYYNSLMGHPIGPDADQFHFESEFYPGGNFLIRGSFDFFRHGQTTISSVLINDALLEQHKPDFPWGIVEQNTLFKLQAEYSPDINWFINLTWCKSTFLNWQNSEDLKNSFSYLKIQVQYSFHNLLRF